MAKTSAAARHPEAKQQFVVVASGPSLTSEDCLLARQLNPAASVIAVNSSWQAAPFADHLYACDLWWWQNNLRKLREANFGGQLWTQDTVAAAEFGLNHIPSINKPGLSRDPGVIHQGMNSGYQAINLVYLWGATKILLLGFDMQYAPNGSVHFHPPHKASTIYRFEPWIAAMNGLAKDLEAEGVEVLNATRTTALRCFRRVSLETTRCL